MAFVALVLSLLVALLGALGVVAPERLLDVVRRFQTPAGLYAAAAIRLVLGLALLLAAPASRAPEAVRILGVFIVVAGVITPFFGIERFRRLLEWWSALGPGLVRAWAVFALVFGLLLAYTVLPNWCTAQRVAATDRATARFDRPSVASGVGTWAFRASHGGGPGSRAPDAARGGAQR